MASPPAPGNLRAMLVALDGDRPDAELLARFHADRDHAAFADLVRRHGPMVLGVCRRVLGRSADADDAFQAAFVVLARKAAAIRRPELLGHWLYGVAVRVARRARRTAARRRNREVLMATPPDVSVRDHEPQPELAGILDAELARLPEWYRVPVVLCDLQGLTRAAAAARLGVAEGTLSSRLAAGRKKLAARLARRGVTLAALTAFLTDHTRADVPESLLSATLESAVAAVVGGSVPAAVAHLAAEGAFPMRMMLLLAATLTLAAAGLALTATPADEKKPAKAEAKKDEPKAEKEAAVRTEYAKPKMVAYYDLSSAPASVRWGADAKRPYLFVEVAGQAVGTKAVGVIRPDDEQMVTQYELPPGHRLIDVFSGAPTFVSARVETGGINALRELRYFTSDHPLDKVRDNAATVVKDGTTRYVGNTFSRPGNWLDPTAPGTVGPVALDIATGTEFKLTADAKGLWNTYSEWSDADQDTHTGLRRLNPITGEVEKQLSLVPTFLYGLAFDQNARVAVAIRRAKTKDKIWASGVTAWDLAAGKVAWTADPPKDMGPMGAAVSGDGRVVAVSYRMKDWQTLRQLVIRPGDDGRRGGSFGGLPGGRGAKLSDEDVKKALDALPAAVIHLHDAATGKVVKEIALKKEEEVSQMAFSPDGALLLTQGSHVGGAGQAQIFDAATGKRVHQWWGDGLFAFRPAVAGQPPLLAVAETVFKSGRPAASDSPENRGRLGLWRIDAVEAKK
jgi:RNA polymerase sigma factor (sigma-70 family)